MSKKRKVNRPVAYAFVWAPEAIERNSDGKDMGGTVGMRTTFYNAPIHDL